MSTVEIKSRMVDGAAIIYPGPYLNQLRGEDIENLCQKLLRQGINRLVINFQETELINSIGISILLGVIEAVNDGEGCLVLSNLSATNRELFEMLGLLDHVRIEDSEQAALDVLLEQAGTAAR
ncbi:MAG TPA: STAS domain-containing protein [Blastocatellia bacterium]|nr:STAS domain-containing protein [Blastocatellia bacterium]